MKYIKKAVVIDAIQVKANNFDRIMRSETGKQFQIAIEETKGGKV